MTKKTATNTATEPSEDEALDMAIAIIAEATTTKQAVEDLMMKRLNLRRSPLLGLVLQRGLRDIARDNRYGQKLHLKVLALNPEHYAELEQAQGQDAQSPASARYREKRAAKDAESKERSTRVFAEWKETCRKIDAAVQFYESWKLSNGIALGDATKENLVAEAKREELIADGHSKNVAFYSALADRLNPGQQVRDGIDLAAAHQLREGIYRDEKREAA